MATTKSFAYVLFVVPEEKPRTSRKLQVTMRVKLRPRFFWCLITRVRVHMWKASSIDSVTRKFQIDDPPAPPIQTQMSRTLVLRPSEKCYAVTSVESEKGARRVLFFSAHLLLRQPRTQKRADDCRVPSRSRIRPRIFTSQQQYFASSHISI